MPSGLKRRILPRGLREILRRAGVEVLAGREVDLAVVAEIDRAAVVLGVGVLRILVEDELAARDGARQRGVGGEARQAITVRRPGRVEDVIVVVGREVRIERDVVDALLHAGGADIGELQEWRRDRLCIGRRQYLDRPRELHDEHAAIGQELDGGRKVEVRSQGSRSGSSWRWRR